MNKDMNIIHHYTKGLLWAVAALSTVALASCKDEPDKFESTGGKPTIKYIRCMSSEIHNWDDPEGTLYTDGQLVTSANPGSTLAVIGENLRSVYEIWFNDKRASVNQSTLTDNALFVTIPAGVPNEVSDKIYFITTSKDTVTYDFKVIIAAPVINSMPNEYAKAGSTLTLKGNYFIDDPGTPLTISFPGENGTLIPAKITNIAEDFTSVEIVVPEGAQSGPIVATSVYGTSKSSFWYKDNRGMLFDFDTPNGISSVVLDMHAWNGHTMTIDDGTGISGNFWQFGNESTTAPGSADNGWPDEGWHSFAYWPGNWESPETFKEYPRLYDLVDMSSWESMTMKFEMCIPASNPWKGAALQIVFVGTDRTTFGAGGVDAYGNTVHVQTNDYLNDPAVPRALYRPWTSTGSYDTNGEWITVSLPLAASFVYSYDGGLCSATLSKDSFASIWMALYGGGIEGTDSQPIIKIDNIRIVPNK
jgi:hypothetical protein